MPPASLVLSKSVVAPVSNGEGTGSINTGAPDVSTDNQSDSNSFPLIMKRIAPVEKDKITDDLLSMGLTADGKMIPPKEADASLPPSGMILPYMLSQSLVSECTPLKGGTPNIRPSIDSTRDNGINMVATPASRGSVKQAGEKLLPTLQQASTVEDAEDLNSSTTATNLSSPYTSLMNTADFGLHGTHGAVQILMNDMGVISDQHNGVVTTPHTGLDTVGAGVTMNSALQGGDKIPQNTTTTSIAVPLHHPEWSEELSNRVTWMIRQDMQSASVKINPSHLGPLDMKVSVINDQVNISFSSHHAPVREALDASIPRLREMLGDNGLQLGDANVTHQSFSDQNQTNQHTFSHSNSPDALLDVNSSGENTENSVKSTTISFFTSAAIDIYA